ncbi:MAG: glycoside hydrolase family 3 C-terminal domain-containing protein [Ardenticatenaceae bacterium]|nr:glycoside hydrolase family 3 C-terminal domain-containing protein [Anaerolineales bacterium]MCB8938260.1 glycoside hydrolase family 3 C-terminal domain-containing protein [Ardenticatenaceae bacterium]MCB8975625.1 glycoside hydrolase family 3 C-terminal domain-containing protein [Ardenticatenaceae bacterium]
MTLPSSANPTNTAVSASNNYNQLDPATEARVEDLLSQMTLTEKIGQLFQLNPFGPFDRDHFEAQKAEAAKAERPFHYIPQLRHDMEDLLREGRIGSFLNVTIPSVINHCQRIIMEESRLRIPLIVGSDVIHGYRTIFPIPLGESATWNPALLEQASRVAAEEASAAGVDWIYAPMVDIARDPRWGRIAEGAGEDPFVGMAMARARVRGFQSTDLTSGRRIAACPKHYIGYGAAEAGRDYNTTDFSERTLRDVYLPPFVAAFDAGAGSVMSSFNEISGVPATANPLVLKTILRHELQWPGLVVSDYESVAELVPHGIAADLKDAARLSILAGLDIEMVSDGYPKHLPELIESGEVPLAAVDEAVRRVLRLKFRLGLFENPYTDETLADKIMLRPDFRELALEVAQESMVLLKNEADILPLSPQTRLAVIGPLANNRADLLGCWSLHNHPEDVETVLKGLSVYLPEDHWEYVAGCAIRDEAPPDIAKAVKAAEAADVVLLVLGEGANMSGEGHSRTHLGLPGRQQELVDAVAATGKPLVCVLMSGRPLVIPQLNEQVQALLAAWHGGIRAGRAIADILFGTVNPSGKLTASWPRSEGQIPVYYAHKNTGRPAHEAGTKQFAELFKSVYIDAPNSPLFPFGFGLSYTQFAYSNLKVERPFLGLDETLIVSATVTNCGSHAGAEVVQLYVRDLVGSVTRPVKELKGFQKISLQPGEQQTVRFEIPVCKLGFTGWDMNHRVEPGDFKVWIGPNSATGLEGDFAVTAR